MPYHTTKKKPRAKKRVVRKVPAGFHRMSDGSIMKNGKHKKKK
jgi:hypothetical protein